MSITRRRLCAVTSATLFAGLGGCTGGSGGTDADGDEWAWSGSLPVDGVVQHHDPSCGCCSKYAAYLEENGIAVDERATDDRDANRRELGVPEEAASCHTLEVGDYLVEGHVPLEAIEELLAEEPDVDGLAIPGMPRHAPGMGPPGDEPLTVSAFDASGDLEPFLEV